MQIKLDENGFVQGYAIVGGTGDGVEIDIIPQEVKDNYQNYKYVNGEFIKDNTLIEKEKIKELLEQELNDIKEWFNNTDYIVLKVFRGNWQPTDERYINYLSEYEIKHARKAEIELILAGE